MLEKLTRFIPERHVYKCELAMVILCKALAIFAIYQLFYAHAPVPKMSDQVMVRQLMR